MPKENFTLRGFCLAVSLSCLTLLVMSLFTGSVPYRNLKATTRRDNPVWYWRVMVGYGVVGLVCWFLIPFMPD